MTSSNQSIAPFTHITSNLKCLVDVDLGPLTFICGPNRSYKTSIRQSIRLALLRELTVQNKKTPLKTPGKLIDFLAKEIRDARTDTALTIQLQSASGFVDFNMPIVDRKAKEPLPRRVVGDVLSSMTEDDWTRAFPMDSVRKMLFFDSRQTREAIVRVFGDATAITAPLGLSDLQKRVWAEGLAVVTADDTLDPVSSLSALSAWAREQKPKKTRMANKRETDLAVFKNKASVSGTEMLGELEAKLAKATAWESAAKDRTAREIAGIELPKLEAKLATLVTAETTGQADHRRRIDEIQAKIDATAITISTAQDKCQSLTRRLGYGEELCKTLKKRVAEGISKCPLGEHPVPVADMAKAAAQIEKIVATRQKEYEAAQLEATQAKTAHDKLQSAIRDEYSRYQNASREGTSAVASTRASISALRLLIEGLNTTLAKSPASYVGLTAAELAIKVSALKEVDSARSTYESGMNEVRRLHEESAASKVVETEAQAIMQRVLLKSKDAAEAKVNEFMPPGFRAEINLAEDDCEWRVVGDDGNFHDSSSSGSEFGSLLVALICATGGSRLKILDMDDEDLHAFDPENIQGLWKAIERAVKSGALTQAIVVWNRPAEAPARKDGWLIIAKHRVGVGPKAVVPADDMTGNMTGNVTISPDDWNRHAVDILAAQEAEAASLFRSLPTSLMEPTIATADIDLLISDI